MSWAVVQREVQLAVRRRAQWLNPLLFYTLVVTVFPLGISADADLLRSIAPGVLWIAALLAVLLSLDSLFRPDWQDGTLEQMLLAAQSPQWLMAIKLGLHWLMIALPLALVMPLLSLLLFLPPAVLPLLWLTLLLGTLALSQLGALMSALTLGVARSGLLITVMTLPLYSPILIFATQALMLAQQGLPYGHALALLAILTLLLSALTPWVIVPILRLSVAQG